MKKLRMQVLSVILVAMFAFLTACKSGEVTNETTNSSTSNLTNDSSSNATSEIVSPKGRYIEEEYSLPEGVQDIVAIKSLQDSSIRMLTNNGVFNSTDGGSTWIKDDKIDLSPYTNDNSYIYIGDIDNEGNIIMYVSMSTEEEEKYQITLIDNTSEIHTTEFVLSEESIDNMTNRLLSLKYSSTGDVVALDFANNILIFEPNNGEIKNQIYKDDTYRISVDCVGETIIVQTLDGVELYNLSGDILESDSIVSQLLTLPSDDINVSSDIKSLVVPGDEGKGFYSCNRNGIFHYMLRGSTVEQLVSPNLNSIGNLSYIFRNMVVKQDQSFLVVYTSADGSQNLIIKNYTFSEDADVRPSGEVTVYSLYDSKILRQEITIFNSNNPDIYANYEVGIAENTSMTESDAIKTLNTNIMTGTGPDILIMDGMPIQTLIDKGILVDLSSTIEEISKTEGVFESIANTYSVDGKTYAIPSRYIVPLIVGNESNLDKISNLSTLADQVSELKDKNPNITSVMGMYDEKLLKTLFDISSSAWLNEDGTLDEEKLKEFLDTANQIQEVQSEGVSQEDIDDINNLYVENPDNAEIIQLSNLTRGDQKLAFVEIDTLNHFNIMPHILETEGMSYELAEGQSKNVFIPTSIIGINAKGQNIDGAAVFVKQFLSSEIQSIQMEGGLPVNRAAFDNIAAQQIEVKDDGEIAYGPDEDIEANPISESSDLEKEISKLKSMIETLGIRTVIDSTIKNTVIGEGIKYLSGDASLDEAVNNVLQKVNIYLAE